LQKLKLEVEICSSKLTRGSPTRGCKAIRTLLYSGWVRTIYIEGMGFGVARDAVRHVLL